MLKLAKYSTEAENWRHQIVIVIIAIAGLIDSLICICTLGFYETTLRIYVALDLDCLDEWAFVEKYTEIKILNGKSRPTNL